MYPFNDYFYTEKSTKGENLCEYIIIHHTAGNTYAGNCKRLSGPIVNPTTDVSAHFVIGENEERAKIGDPKDILWHCGISSRGVLEDMKKYCLGIEVVGYGNFNQYQFIALTDLVQYLMGTFKIPKENVLRHSDITQNVTFTKAKILRDGKRSARKVDIAEHFFPMGFIDWREKLYPRQESRYGLYR